MIGSKVAHFEITALLGSGGMGEVYQATDTKLGRSVAIKVLPEAFTHDSDRLARFEREARVLASLNHPQIAAIYGLEESGERKLLVMELVEGETLADRIARGPIPIDEALPIAKQICEALEAAHEKGIIHRDLKPANIKVREDGTVKVLDFGLAKAMEPVGVVSHGVSQSPTISTPAMTQMGVIMGTAAYMSPEQAKGRPADKRADIWAFGCVLYEMLTGKRAFDGEDVADTLAFVLTKEPDWNALPAATPVSIRRLLRRSLEKDRKRRLPDMADARIEIDDAWKDREVVAQPAVPDGTTVRRGERVAWIVAVLLATVLTAAVSFGVSYLRAPTDATEMRLDIVTPGVSESLAFAISPDGRQLVFVASGDGQRRLWLRSLDAERAQPMAGTEGAEYPFWSPDSRSVGFFAEGKLKRIDIGGGAPRTLANAPLPSGGAWSPDGVILFSPGSSNPLSRVPATGGEADAFTKLDPPRQIQHSFPAFLPDGRQFLFHARGAPEVQGIYIGSLDSPETKRLVATDRPPGVYVLPEWLLFTRQGALVAQRFDPLKRALSGDPVLVADSLALVGLTSSYAPAAFSASATGLVGYRTEGAAQTQLTWVDRSGKVLGTLGARDANAVYNPELSPDGRQVAVRRVVDNNADLWLMNDTRMVRFTVDAGIDQYPVWSPDGNWIAFSSLRKGPSDLYRKRATGGGDEELLIGSPQVKNLDDWSPDGRFLLYNAQDDKTGRDLWILPLEGDRKPFVFLKTNFEEHRGQFSPDGRWITYVSDESGRPEIYVRPFPGPGGQWQVSTNGGVQPRWNPNGKELYYIAPDGRLMAVLIALQNGAIEPGVPMALFQTRLSGGGMNIYTKPQYDVARDGRFLVNVITDAGTTAPITLLLNWKPPAN